MKKYKIKEIQQKSAYPDSISVQQALIETWDECEKEILKKFEDDAAHLVFIYARMVEFHNENSNRDYMIKFQEIIKSMKLNPDDTDRAYNKGKEC